MTKTTYRLLFHFSSLFLKFHSFTPTTFLANLCTYEFVHFFNINASIQQVSELLCCFLFLLDHVWGTEPKLELMLNMSAKTTESSKPHIFYSFQGGLISVLRVDQLNPHKSGFFSQLQMEKLNRHEEP